VAEPRPAGRRLVLGLTALFLLIELLDELVFAAREAAWPLVRADLGLSYVQIGALLSIPALIAALAEPILGLLADTWRRYWLILGGGLVCFLALAAAGLSPGYVSLLIAFIFLYPGSGAFVSVPRRP